MVEKFPERRFSDRLYKVAALAIAPFATETGGLFQTGNSVASAEQTSAALILSADICVNRPDP